MILPGDDHDHRHDDMLCETKTPFNSMPLLPRDPVNQASAPELALRHSTMGTFSINTPF
jgi:hypothetical protein